MPICSKCNIEKLSSEFMMKQERRKSYSYCKKCQYNYQMVRWNKTKIRAIAHKGGKCSKCGFEGHPALFDFHHRDPIEKESDWSSMKKRNWDKIVIELEKCDLLCCMCHRMQHIVDACWTDWEKWEEQRTFEKPKPQCKCGNILISGDKFCSPECCYRSAEVIEWPENLPELVTSSSKRAVAASLGVSDKAVAKRLKNHF